MAQEALTDIIWLNRLDLVVTRTLSDGTTNTLNLDGDYELGGDGANGAGWIRAVNSEDSDTIYRILRQTDPIQARQFPKFQPIDSSEMEAGLDQMAMIAQESRDGQQDLTNRALQVPQGETVPPLPIRAEREGFALWQGGGLIGATVTTLPEGSVVDALTNDSDMAPSGRAVTDTLSSTALINKAMMPYNVDGSNIPGIALRSGGGLIFRQSVSRADDVHAIRIERAANYISSLSSFENCALAVYSTVSETAQSYETGIVVVMDNSADSGPQNSGLHVRALKRGLSPTWNQALETQDMTGAANPTTGLIGIENVIAANGSDANRNRIGLDIIAARPISGGAYSGAAASIGAGIRLINQSADPTQPNNFTTGILFAGYYGADCIDTSTANITPGGSAIRLGNGQSLAFTVNRDRTWDYTASLMNYRVAGTPVFQIGDNCTFVSRPVNFADLPEASALLGARALVKDCTTTAFYGIVTGGGDKVTPVFSDGNVWRVG